jgi:hypothetical protein
MKIYLVLPKNIGFKRENDAYLYAAQYYLETEIHSDIKEIDVFRNFNDMIEKKRKNLFDYASKTLSKEIDKVRRNDK